MRKVLYKVWRWCKGEAVLVAAALGAVVTAFFVPPSVAYLGYIDGKVLCLLFCLMAVVAGWRECGVFEVMAQRVLSGRKNVRVLQLLLVLLPFFMSMLITNDVALITFVPFTLLVLQMANEADRILPVVILQAVAANLGSMATPVGNPQNLFLCGKFNLTAGDFFATLLPFTVISFVALCIAALWGKKRDGAGILQGAGTHHIHALVCGFGSTVCALPTCGVPRGALWAGDACCSGCVGSHASTAFSQGGRELAGDLCLFLYLCGQYGRDSGLARCSCRTDGKKRPVDISG